MGGLLSDPVTSYPAIFGPQAIFGLRWMETYPYALPSILNAIFLAITTGVVFLGLEEVCMHHVRAPFRRPL